MDETDRRILDLLQRDAAIPRDELATRVGASLSSLHRRVRALHGTGAIRSIVALVDPNTVGRPLTFIVSLEVERKNPELYGQLKRWLAQEDAVQQAFNVTGEHDFILIITARTVADYDELMDRMISANGNIKKYQTNVVLNAFKRGAFVPVSGP